MIKRFIILAALLAALLLYAAFAPIVAHRPSESRWLKVDQNGKPLHAWSGPWSCVCDTQTGLLWEVKNDGEGIHDGYWSYSWFDGKTGEPNKGDCYFEEQRCDTLDLIRRANMEKTCGYSDWRLPTTAELQSLIFEQTRPGEPMIDKTYFPHSKRGDYWTQDAHQPLTGVFGYLKEGSKAISFVDGKVVNLPYRNAAFVRLVTNPSKTCNTDFE